MVGRHGAVYDEEGGVPRVGRTDVNGNVYDSMDGDHVVGRVEGEPKYYAGAALLLLRDKLVKQ